MIIDEYMEMKADDLQGLAAAHSVGMIIVLFKKLEDDQVAVQTMVQRSYNTDSGKNLVKQILHGAADAHHAIPDGDKWENFGGRV